MFCKEKKRNNFKRKFKLQIAEPIQPLHMMSLFDPLHGPLGPQHPPLLITVPHYPFETLFLLLFDKTYNIA